MFLDIKRGNRGEYEGKDYFHNRKIDIIFQRARRRAWASIMNDPSIRIEVEEQKEAKIRRMKKTKETTDILSIYK